MSTIWIIVCATIIATHTDVCGTRPMPLKEAMSYVDSSNVLNTRGDVFYWLKEAQPCEISGGC